MPAVSPSLAALFPEGDYRFHLTLRRAKPEDFFRVPAGAGAVLEERRRWISADPSRYTAMTPEGEALLHEFAAMAQTWTSAPVVTIEDVGRAFDVDVLLLSPDEVGPFRLRAGALCFPTGWALEEKIGHTLEFIHGVVPGLNAALGTQIHSFLSKLKPDVAFLRDNWGLAATDELNLHPARQISAPTAPVALDRLWLRVEHQALVALPQTGGVAFGIRIALHRLDAVARSPAAPGLRRALETMPAELAAYKRLDAVRDEVVRLL